MGINKPMALILHRQTDLRHYQGFSILKRACFIARLFCFKNKVRIDPCVRETGYMGFIVQKVASTLKFLNLRIEGG